RRRDGPVVPVDGRGLLAEPVHPDVWPVPGRHIDHVLDAARQPARRARRRGRGRSGGLTRLRPEGALENSRGRPPWEKSDEISKNPPRRGGAQSAAPSGRVLSWPDAVTQGFRPGLFSNAPSGRRPADLITCQGGCLEWLMADSSP